MSQSKQSKQQLTKEIRLLSEATTYILIEIGENDMKVSLFYLIHPANSNSREISGIVMRFLCFMSIFNLSSAYCVTGETVETTTDQRNLSIIGRGKIYISSKKREEMQFIYLFDESR